MKKYCRIYTLVLVNLAPSWDIKGRSQAAFDIPTRGQIHQYQCNNPLLFSYKYFALFVTSKQTFFTSIIQTSEPTELHDNFARRHCPRRHRKQYHVMVTFEGIP